VAVVADELHFKCLSVLVHQHGRSHVTAFQAVGGQIAREGDCIQFLDGVNNFGSGWAVANLGALLIE
jgi:hypothetical protein